MVVTVLLLVFVLVAVVTDMTQHKIYNWTTYPGMLIALVINAAGFGLVDWYASLLGLLLCGLAMVACFVCFKVGGGDVKLMAMIGAALGYEQGLTVMLWTFVLGACMGIIVLIWRVGPWALMTQTLRHLMWTIRLGQFVPLTPEERALLQPPLFLAPCALAAIIIVQFF